jgi:hypothetical protein
MPLRVEDLERHGILGNCFERKIQHGLRAAHEAICGSRFEQDDGGIGAMLGHLFQGRDVVEYVESAAVGRDHEVVKSGLYDRPGHGCRGQPGLERRPVLAVVERVIRPVAGAGEQEPRAVGILGDALDIGQRVFRQVAIDPLPRLAEVGGLVDEGVAVVREVKIDADVRSPGIEVRRSDARDRAPRRKS